MLDIQLLPTPEPPSSAIAALVAKHRLPPEKKLSVDDIVAILQQTIIRGIYAPGRALRQDELAQVLGVSKIPVREALRTLQANDFVQLHQYRGAVVKGCSLAQLHEVCQLREMLEPALMRDAFFHIDKATFDTLDSLMDQMDSATHAWRFSELNVAFHQTLYAPSQKTLSLQILAMLHGHIQRMSFMQLSLSGHNDSANREEHRAIVAACRAGDIDLAVHYVTQHVVHIREVILTLYQQQGLDDAALALRNNA